MLGYYSKIQDVINASIFNTSSSSSSLLSLDDCRDVFQRKKRDAFFKDISRIMELVTRPTETSQNIKDQFRYHLYMSLWGNQSDLSILASKEHGEALLTAATNSDNGNILAETPFLLQDDSLAILKHFQEEGTTSNRIDYILDNAGLELVSDLFFIDWILRTFPDKVKQIVIHGKKHP